MIPNVLLIIGETERISKNSPPVNPKGIKNG